MSDMMGSLIGGPYVGGHFTHAGPQISRETGCPSRPEKYLTCRVSACKGFGVLGLGFGVWGLGFRVNPKLWVQAKLASGSQL